MTFSEEREHFGSEDDAVKEATTLTYDRVLDAVIGTAAGVTGIISFDNYAQAGVIEQTSVTAEELEESKWTSQLIRSLVDSVGRTQCQQGHCTGYQYL